MPITRDQHDQPLAPNSAPITAPSWIGRPPPDAASDRSAWGPISRGPPAETARCPNDEYAGSWPCTFSRTTRATRPPRQNGEQAAPRRRNRRAHERLDGSKCPVEAKFSIARRRPASPRDRAPAEDRPASARSSRRDSPGRRGDQHPAVPMLDDLGRAALVAGDDRLARQHRLDDHPPKRLRRGRGVDDDVANLHQCRDCRSGNRRTEPGPPGPPPVPGPRVRSSVRVLPEQRLPDDQRLGAGQTGSGPRSGRAGPSRPPGVRTGRPRAGRPPGRAPARPAAVRRGEAANAAGSRPFGITVTDGAAAGSDERVGGGARIGDHADIRQPGQATTSRRLARPKCSADRMSRKCQITGLRSHRPASGGRRRPFACRRRADRTRARAAPGGGRASRPRIPASARSLAADLQKAGSASSTTGAHPTAAAGRRRARLEQRHGAGPAKCRRCRAATVGSSDLAALVDEQDARGMDRSGRIARIELAQQTAKSLLINRFLTPPHLRLLPPYLFFAPRPAPKHGSGPIGSREGNDPSHMRRLCGRPCARMAPLCGKAVTKPRPSTPTGVGLGCGDLYAGRSDAGAGGGELRPARPLPRRLRAGLSHELRPRFVRADLRRPHGLPAGGAAAARAVLSGGVP